jgi:urease beta subunit
MKPSRTCERSKREGVRQEPDDYRFAKLVTVGGARNLRGGAL